MKDLLRFCTSGSVDDGKSTLLGRLLFETGRIYDDQLEAVKKSSDKRNKEDIDLSLLLDGLESEREQSITIDVAYRYFETDKRRFIVADTPGHEQYTRNMVTGASNSSLALILIDARNGVLTQSKRHGFINSLLNISHLVVAVNKMDLVNWSQDVFDEIVNEYKEFSEKLNIKDIKFVPVSALTGDNVCSKSENMKWYDGSTILNILETVSVNVDRNHIDFRFPVQTVIRPHLNFRGYAGRVASGKIKVGEDIIVLPSKFNTKVIDINFGGESIKEAEAGDSVILNLSHELDISRGDMIVRKGNIPTVSDRFIATICWMSEEPLKKISYILKTGTRKVNSFVNSVKYKIDVNTLHRQEVDQIVLNDIFKATIETTSPIFFDPYLINRETGSFILIDPETNNTVACGMIKCSEEKNKEVKHLSGEAKNGFNGEKGKVIWMTGLSGSGKSTIAEILWEMMEGEGYKTIILDGDSVRKGLCSDLGFSLNDRRENLRRVAEISKILSDNGINVITAFISPTKEIREMAEEIIGKDVFHEIYIRCSLEECENRDPKGLYKKSKSEEIKNFTGVTSPYIPPSPPCITVETDKNDKLECSRIILERVF